MRAMPKARMTVALDDDVLRAVKSRLRALASAIRK